jgi:hypothetical protein
MVERSASYRNVSQSLAMQAPAAKALRNLSLHDEHRRRIGAVNAIYYKILYSNITMETLVFARAPPPRRAPTPHRCCVIMSLRHVQNIMYYKMLYIIMIEVLCDNEPTMRWHVQNIVMI